MTARCLVNYKFRPSFFTKRHPTIIPFLFIIDWQRFSFQGEKDSKKNQQLIFKISQIFENRKHSTKALLVDYRDFCKSYGFDFLEKSAHEVTHRSNWHIWNLGLFDFESQNNLPRHKPQILVANKFPIINLIKSQIETWKSYLTSRYLTHFFHLAKYKGRWRSSFWSQLPLAIKTPYELKFLHPIATRPYSFFCFRIPDI